MKVFADFHHDDLFHSLYLLFEKRLGWELFVPAGPEWYTQGFWRYSVEPRVIDEYLVSGKKVEDCGAYSLMENPCHGRNLKALTFEQFKQTEVDLIISSVPEHEVTYWQLRNQYQPQAKLIQHWGNEWKGFKPQFIKNWMVSCAPFRIPSGVNAVFYHQEFDQALFGYAPGNPEWPVRSFVNDLPHLKDWGLFRRYEKALPEWRWRSHGLGCRDGNVRPLKKYAEKLKQSSFVFHAKSLGDGFGHVIHNIFSAGRPALVRSRYYRGRLAEALIQDGVTCIDLDRHTFEENCALIRKTAGGDNYFCMGEKAAARFRQLVNYDEEERRIRQFLERLV